MTPSFVNGSSDASLLTVGYEHMTDKEKALYNYYYNTYGAEKGEEYLNTIIESLGARKANKDFENLEGKTFSELSYGIVAGLDQFTSGVKNLFNTSDKYIPVNATQQLSGLVREDITYEHGTLGQVGYDLINTTSNMLPSILTSSVVGAINPVAGQVVGATLMGASASGNAYQEMINLGYDKNQARTYSVLVGASEAGLQYALGGIGKLGGVSGKLSKVVSGIDNGIAKFAIRWGGSALSEGFEEAVQEVLNPLFTNIAAGYDTGADVDWSEVVYSGLLGALSGGMLEGRHLAVNSIAEHSFNKQMGQTIKANERVGDVFDIASNPEVASAYEAYTRYAKKGIKAENISDAKLGNLYSSAKADAIETFSSKKSTVEQKQGAMQTLARLGTVQTENTVKKEAQKDFNIGEETKVNKSGALVDVKDLKIKVNGDEITVATNNNEISVDDMTFAQNDAKLVVLAKGIAKLGGEDFANLFLSQYDGKTNVEEYANSFNLTMDYAKNNYLQETILENKGSLSTELVKEIYTKARVEVDKARQDAIDQLNKDMADKMTYKGYINDSAIDEETWNKLDVRQRQAVTFIKGFAQAAGMNLVLTYNPEDKHGGSYIVRSNTITIDIAKYKHIQKGLIETIIPTMSHETTHWMEEKSPELWNKINELVFSTLQEADGISEIDRIAYEIKTHEKKGRKVTEKEARSEIIARACEDMLKMSEQGKKMFNSLSESEKKNFTDKIKELIQNLKDWVGKLLGSYESSSYEAKVLRQYEEKLNELSKLWDEMLVKSVEANQALEKSGAFKKHGVNENVVKYSFRNSKNGLANDLLLPYDEELTQIISNRGDYIVDSFETLENIVDLALENRTKKGTAYFGIIPIEVLNNIENSVPNIPKELNGLLFKPNKDYSVAATLDSIRHLQDEKDLSRDEIVDYLDRMADTIVEFDSANFDYYYNKGSKSKGVLFKKTFSDGVLESFEIVSNNKKTLNLQTVYMENGDYKKKKSAKTLLMENPSANAQGEDWSNFNGIISNPDEKVKEKFSDRDSSGREISEGQQEYFKDSVVRDEDGNLLVMYRGDSNEFTVFDRKKTNYSNLYGRGFYFTKNKSHAEQYGTSREFYLDIKHPLSPKQNVITKSQMLNFLKAIENDGEDYDLYNYGQDATAESVLNSVWGKGDFEMLQDISAGAIGDLVAAVELFNEVNGTNYDGIILPTETVTFNSEQAKLTSNLNPTKDKDIRFSMRDNVEETKDLIAVHNVSPGKLLKTLKLGGLPMPSIAITRAREGYTNFGDISLVFGKDTIDPQFMRNNKVYSGDAWTPTYPHIEYKLNTKAQEKIKKKIDALVPNNVQTDLGGTHLDSYNMENELNRHGDMVTSYRYNYAMKYAFLKDNNVDIELPTKEEPLYRYGQVSNNAVISFANKLVEGLKTANSLYEQHSSKLMADEDLLNGIAMVLNEDVMASVDKDSEDYQKLVENPIYKPEDIDLSTVLGMLEASRKYFHTNGRIERKIDYRNAKEKIDDYINSNSLQEEYEYWLKGLFSDVIAKEGIRNNKDLFTPSGNRRSFEALHYEHTLENVVKAMKEEGTKGIGGFGGGNIFGASTIEYGSIDDIKSDAENRMQVLPESKYDEIKKGFTDRLFELAQSLPIHKDSYTAVDDAANMLIEAVSKFKTKSGMANYIRTESKGWANYSDYIVDDLIELVNDIRNMPVAYFEAKPQRAVGYDEIKAVIMPSKESYEDELTEVKSELEKLNIPILEYEYGDNNARLKALNSLEEVRFSDRDSEGNTLTEAQQEYFKDSKVRDEKGNLLVCYHGTDEKFSIFNYDFISQDNKLGYGFYFMAGKELQYSYKYPLKSYLNIKNPLTDTSKNLSKEALSKFCNKLGIEFEYDSNDYDLDVYARLSYSYTGEAKTFLKNVINILGVDGILSKDRNVAVAFASNQIKSVTNTNPTESEDIRYSDRDYSYEHLVNKPDMKLTVLSGNVPNNRADIVHEAKKNAAKVGNVNDKSVSVYVDDIGKDVVLGTKGLEHGLRRAKTLQTDANSFVTLKAGEIIKNSIRINELTPKNQNADASYVLIGAAQNTNGDLYIVESVINQFSNELVSMDVLYSVNAKKENRLRSMRPEVQHSVTDSTISIAELLDYVNKYFPDILPESVLRHYGYDARTDGELGKDALYSDRDNTSVYDVMGERDRLLKENEKFKAEIERLKERLKLERQITNGNYFNENQLGAVAGHLRNIARSTYSKEVLVDGLKDVYSFIAHSPQLTWEEVFAKCYNIADAMIAESTPEVTIDDYSKEILRDIKKRRISLSESQKQEAANIFGKNWNRYFFGKVIVTDKGIPLEGQWQEWAELFPGTFNADISDSNMIGELYDIISTLKETSETVDEYSAEEQKRWLANEIYNQYWNVSTIKTTADKYDKQIKKLNFEHRKAMAEYRTNYENRIAEQGLADDMYYGRKIAEQKDKYNKNLAEYKQKQKERHQRLYNELRERKDREVALAKQHGRDMMDKYKENAERKTTMQSLMSTVSSLINKLEKNDKDVHIPEVLKPVVSNLVHSIDYSSKQLLGIDGSRKDMRGTPTKEDLALDKKFSFAKSLEDGGVTLKQSMMDALKMFQDAEKVANSTSDGKMDLSLPSLDIDLIERIESAIKSLEILEKTEGSTFVLNKMSIEHLKTLNATVKSINHWANQIDYALASQHKARISEGAYGTCEDTDVLGKNKEYIEGIEDLKDFFLWSNLTPINAFERLGPHAMEYFKFLQSAQGDLARNKQDILDFTANLFKDKYKDIKKWRTQVEEFTLKLPNGDTKKVKMPVSYVMALYCLAKQEDAQRHLTGKDKGGEQLTYTDDKGNNQFGGGMTIAPFKDGKLTVSREIKSTILTDSLIKQMTSKLTQEQKDMADALQNYMNTKGSEWGNAVSEKLYGIKKFVIENYFPITVSPTEIKSTEARTKKSQRVHFYSILNFGFTKNRNPQAKQSIEVGDIFEIFANHMSMMAIYNAYALPIYDIVRWYNYKGVNGMGKEINVQSSIQEAFGTSAINYIDNLLSDLNGQNSSSRLGFVTKIFRNTKLAMVGNSLSVALLQPTAYLKAMTQIPTRYLLKSLLYVKDFGAKNGIEKAKKWCGIALWKTQGNFETDISPSMQTEILHDKGFMEKAKEKSLWGAEKMDELTWGVLWNACEFDVRANRKDLKVRSDEFNKAVAEKLERVIYKTQVVDSPLTRSDIMRSPDNLAKMLTMFGSEMTVAYNIVAEAFVDAKLYAKRNGKGSWKRNAKSIGIALTAYTLTSAASQILNTIVQLMRDDEEKEPEDILKMYFTNFFADWLIIGKIPYFKEFLNYAQGYSSSRPDTLWLDSTTKAVKYWIKAFDGKEGAGDKAIKETLKALSYLSGLPMYNQYRDFLATLDTLRILDAEDFKEMIDDIFN